MARQTQQPTDDESYIHTHKGDDPYVHIDKLLVNDRRLGWDTVGLLAYLLGKPNNWKVRMAQLIKFRSAGRDALRRMLREAERFGYVYRTRTNKEKGRFIWVTHVYESPDLNPNFTPPSTGLPSMAEPSTVEPSTVNPSTYQYLSLPMHDLTNELDLPTDDDALPPPFVKADRRDVRSVRADQATQPESAALRLAAHRFGRLAFPNGGFDNLAGYIDGLSVDQLNSFCAACFLSELKAARGDTGIKDHAAFVRSMTTKRGWPGFSPTEADQFDQQLTAYLSGLESDVWDEFPESEYTQ